MVKKIFFISIILLINGITNTTLTNLVVTIPQFCFVLYLIVVNRTDKAVFWHFIFFITSFTYYGDVNSVGILELSSYNYAKFKLFGPISYSHVISIILLIVVTLKHSQHNNANGLFNQFYKLVLLFMISGFLIGFLGLAFSNYYIEGFINYGSYILLIFIHTSILLKYKSNTLKKEFYDIISPVLAILPVINFILHYFNPDIRDSSALSFYSLLIIPALLFRKNVYLYLIGIAFLVHNSIVYGMSGKSLILFVSMIIITFILSMPKSAGYIFPKRAHIIRVTMLISLISIPTIVTIIQITYGGSSFIVSKIHQVTTLFDFIINQGDIEAIAPSPYVRVTSLINILYEGMYNPFVLLFGKGFGGYFQDSLNFFTNLSLYNGGFSDKAILSGHYYTGHDTMVTVPMFNGLIGLFILLRVVWKSIKFSNNNFLILTAIPFLLLAFYFDTLIGVSGVLLLYAGSFNLRDIKLMDND